MKFKPIEARFMHHVLVIVRTASIKRTLHEDEYRAQRDLHEYEYRAQRNLEEEGNHIIISSYWA